MVGIREIAKQAGVSISTVSNVLAGRSNVGKETMNRVLEICKEAGYYPNASARNLKAGNTKTILFNFSDFERMYYLEVIQGINDRLQKSGYDVLVCTGGSLERFLRSRFTDGAIILDAYVPDELLLDTAQADLPIVTLDRDLRSPYMRCVMPDNYGSMAELTEALIQKGHSRFAFVEGVMHAKDNLERKRGVMDVLAAHGTPLPPEMCFNGKYTNDGGYAAGVMIAELGELPDVVVCANDGMAMGVFRALTERGLRVPQDVAITGYDGDKMTRSYASFLTTIVSPLYMIGYNGAGTILHMLNPEIPAPGDLPKPEILWSATTP
ncbi:MAG: LacI family transcriptional regulator [Defluviitaleaceae bacterium]|nr:LacI family transcriptional regulator [Defluviitaleaceae bacterium]